MAVQFFFGHGVEQFGPFPANRMRELAAAGEIQPTDMVWQEGDERRCPAARVKNLFPVVEVLGRTEGQSSSADSPTGLTAPADQEHPRQESHAAPVNTPAAQSKALSQAEAPALAATPPASRRHEARKRRVVCLKGAVLLGQDGVEVKFKKKCSVCGYEDPTRSTTKIPMGFMRLSFFCRDCRKSRPVEISGAG